MAVIDDVDVHRGKANAKTDRDTERGASEKESQPPKGAPHYVAVYNVDSK